MFRITNPQTPPAEAGKVRFFVRDLLDTLRGLRQIVRARRARRRTCRKWQRMTPEQQLAFWMSVLAGDPQLRDAFRRALRVRGVPESQQDDRRVIPAGEFAAKAAAAERAARVSLV